MRRPSRGYDGIQPTSRHLQDLLPKMRENLVQKFKSQPNEILKAWEQLVGPKIAAMSEAISFDHGVLRVRVTNSTLYSLLMEHEKERLLLKLKKSFPKTCFQNIVFRLG